MQSGPIYLIGPSGNPNFGDEFIAAAWLKYLAEVRPDADIWLDCPQPGLASILFDGLHPRLRVTNTLWRLVHETAELPLETAAETIRARVTGLGSRRTILAFSSSAKPSPCTSSAVASSMRTGPTMPDSCLPCVPCTR
jgi:polysaccharide pyruvyl transferase WcaK-like protein